MTSLARQKILDKLENFKEYSGYLHQLRREAKDEETFLSDFHLFGNTERYLQLSIQIIIDVSHLIIIDLDLPRPEDNYEAISILYEKEIISGGLADKITRMIGLRNLLVHEYGRIDRKKIFEILNGNLKDLEMFSDRIADFVKKEKG
jgi:uncharacterized protein YutE (UPF0331/DUF86 family)